MYLYAEIPDVIFVSGIIDCKQFSSVKRINLTIYVLRDRHYLAHLAEAKWAYAITWRPSSVVRRRLTFHMQIFSSEIPRPNE
jgi:hypothetical protein